MNKGFSGRCAGKFRVPRWVFTKIFPPGFSRDLLVKVSPSITTGLHVFTQIFDGYTRSTALEGAIFSLIF